MSEWLRALSEYTVTIIDLMAFIVVGTVRAFVSIMRVAVSAPVDRDQRSQTWLTYGRWLVAGLTFQLAADIIESSIASSWDSVGRLARDCGDPNVSQLFLGAGYRGGTRGAQ